MKKLKPAKSQSKNKEKNVTHTLPSTSSNQFGQLSAPQNSNGSKTKTTPFFSNELWIKRNAIQAKSAAEKSMPLTARSIKDPILRDLLCLDIPFFKLLKRYTTANLLRLDPTASVPFFAEIRNYLGAKESDGSTWIAKPIEDKEILSTATGTIVYLLDRFTGTPSAPTILSKIGGKLYRATKTINKADQLSGANYTVKKELKEQLALDLINRWIFADEDRNPNNYLIRSDTRNTQFIIPIDFGNSDLTSETIKIKGLSNRFGWARKEKTQYLTPLKMNCFTDFDMSFYRSRLHRFRKIDEKLLRKICDSVFSLCSSEMDYGELTNRIVKNVLARVKYVNHYFEKHIPDHIEKSNKYSRMGEAFMSIASSD